MKVRVRLQLRPRGFLYSALLIVSISATAFSQTTTTTENPRNTLQGDIVLPGGARLDHPILVRLSTNRGEQTTTSNGNGSFVFRQLGGGSFVVSVDPGDPYEMVSETVHIDDAGSTGNMSRIGQIYNVQLHLRLKPGAPINKGVILAKEPPKEALDLYNKALESVKTGEREKAIEQLKAAIAIFPEFVAALNGLGVQYMKLGKYQYAFESFNSALILSPDSFILHLNCGITLFNLNRYSEAERELTAAITKNEAAGAAHLYRARASIGLKHFDDAVKDLKRAIEIGGDDVKLAHRYLAGIYMEKGENAAAVKELELYLKSSPTTRESDQIKDLIKELNKKAAGQ